MKIYSNLENEIINYYETHENAQCYIITGCLLDNYILISSNGTCAIVKERYVNCWTSGHTFRKYNQLPKKYMEVIKLLENDEEEKAEKLFFA